MLDAITHFKVQYRYGEGNKNPVTSTDSNPVLTQHRHTCYYCINWFVTRVCEYCVC